MLDSRQSRWPKSIDRWLGIALVCAMAVLRRLTRWLWRSPGKARPLRVLVIKLSALGDLVTMLPALYLMNQELSGAPIDFLGGASNVDLAHDLKIFKTIFRFSRKSVVAVCLTRYDLVIDFDQWVRATALIAAATRSGLTAGFKSRSQYRHFAFDRRNTFDLTKHNGENFWNLAAMALTQLGLNVSSSFEHDRLSVRHAWRSRLVGRESDSVMAMAPALSKKYVVIHPGCGEHGRLREWPVESWRELVRQMKVAVPETEIVITGHGAYEVALARAVAEAGATSLAGHLTLGQLMTVVAGAQKYISCNTGIMHLASFLNDHVISINGPTNPHLWGPLWAGKNVNSPVACSPCLTWGYDYGCSDPVCVKIIKPREVFKIAHA